MEKCRYITLTDINPAHFLWTEKDDIQSLVRLLLYSNEIDIEGIILCSSCFLKHGGGSRAVKIVKRMLDAYESVKPNLDCHAPGYPSAETLRQCVHLGIPEFGKALGDGFGEEKYNRNPGVQCILAALEKEDSRPLWVGLWGGANTLAQALWQISRTKSSEEIKRILSRLRIHSISDQDNSAKWIRQNFGSDLFYMVTPSNGTTAGTKEYCRAVWPGISADTNGHGSEDGIHGGGFSGADTSLVSKRWIREHIQSKGVLGKQYPKTVFIMEGDTPAFLGLIPNGLNMPERPDYGGWSGRYRQAVSPENTPIWSGDADSVLGNDGKKHHSPQASLWRWRPDFQYDFAARMEWTVTDSFEEGSHPPVVNLKQSRYQAIRVGQTVTIDASDSGSPDGAPLFYRWFWYSEAGTGGVPGKLSPDNTPSTTVTFFSAGTYHLILQVTGARKFPLCRYQRIVFEVSNEIEGGFSL